MLWLYLKDLNSIINATDFFENFQFIKGNNTWDEGNKFSFNWIGLTHLETKSVYNKSYSNKKIIIWKAKGDIGINFYKTLCLYRITKNNKTLVKSIISRTEYKNEFRNYKQTKY